MDKNIYLMEAYRSWKRLESTVAWTCQQENQSSAFHSQKFLKVHKCTQLLYFQS